MDSLTYRIGETKRILHEVSADVAFTITAVAISIYDSTGSVVVNGAAGAAEPAVGNSATSHDIYYNWAPATAGDYTYLLTYTVGAQVIGIRGELAVLPVTSKFDRYVRRCIDWLGESEVGEAQALLSYRQWKDAILTAVREYSRDSPQRKFNNASGETLTAGVWEYALPSDWTDGFSRIRSFEYPVDSTVQARPYKPIDYYGVDELRDKWYFASAVPAAGEKARFEYLTLHALNDETPADTIPALAFDRVCQYAAGEALQMAANRHAGTAEPGIAADVVGVRDRQQRYSAVAAAMKTEARVAWRERLWSL